ncbi:MAG: chemotaxis protein CheB, partial [Bacteroidales bacterium]|nr:chemotaxis protein CheB [Bacteroidales bacterium]
MFKALIIGGSAGSFQVVNKILHDLPKDISVPVFLVLHRLKHVRSGFVEALSLKSNIPVVEPFDKQLFKKGIAYLAPANYHMYFDFGNKVLLSTEEQVNHSRPSIDLSFMSAGYLFKEKLLAVILSGANKDGVVGMKVIQDFGGKTIVQNPADCQVDTMTKGTLDMITPDFILNSENILKKIIELLN